MADSTLSGLPAVSSIDGTELVYVVQSGVDKKASIEQVENYIGRDKMQADRTIYVRTDGNDSNTGAANTAGGAKLTIAGAFALAATLDLNGFKLTVQLADGTYASGAIIVPNLTGLSKASNFVLQGNVATPTNVLLSGSGLEDYFIQSAYGGLITLNGFQITSSGSNSASIDAAGGYLYFSNLDFGAATTAHINAWAAGTIECIGSYTISGGAAYHVGAGGSGLVMHFPPTVTLNGTPNFSTSFAFADINGVVQSTNGATTFSGSATGLRYSATNNGVIQTYGSGANYFPGSIAGTTASGGIYA